MISVGVCGDALLVVQSIAALLRSQADFTVEVLGDLADAAASTCDAVIVVIEYELDLDAFRALGPVPAVILVGSPGRLDISPSVTSSLVIVPPSSSGSVVVNAVRAALAASQH